MTDKELQQNKLLKFKRRSSGAIHEILALALGLLLMFPIIYCIFISFMNPSQILTVPPSFFPREWTLESYELVMRTVPIGTYMVNSMIMALSSSILRVIFGSMAAYAFSFFHFKGRDFLFLICLGTVMIPADVVVITNYKIIADLDLTNTYLGLMSVFCISAMNIFVMRQNFLTFSSSLKDAAYVDGCSNFRFFVSILLPTSVPVLTTVFISSFISIWNQYLWPLLVAHTEEMQTVQIGVAKLNFADGESWGGIMAASVLIVIPTVVVFLVFRRKIIRGMMTGAVKG